MYLLGLGVVLVLLKFFEVGPPSAWAWWQVLIPFALAAAWWTWADMSGYTKRRARAKDEARLRARVDRARDGLRAGSTSRGAKRR